MNLPGPCVATRPRFTRSGFHVQAADYDDSAFVGGAKDAAKMVAQRCPPEENGLARV